MAEGDGRLRINRLEQAGTELGQAQLKLELYYSNGLIKLTGWYISYLDFIN